MINIDECKVAICKRLSEITVIESIAQFKNNVHIEGNAIIKELSRAYRDGKIIFDEYHTLRQFTEGLWHRVAEQFNI